jgi:hypothetical protein
MQGMGGNNFDPNQIFNWLSGGKDVIVRAQLADPMQQRIYDRMAQRMGNPPQITRQQYMENVQQRWSQRGLGGPGGAPGGAGPGGGGPNPDAWAEASFRRLDVNQDGLLNNDEMPEPLRSERDKWDTNKDGFIDLNEYKAYFQQRMADRGFDPSGGGGWGGDPGMMPQMTAPVEEEEKRPVVYRAGKLPKELPPWFEQRDTDKDGQIGLYEWRAAGGSVEDFQAMDRNKDGFLTVEEVLQFEKRNKDELAKAPQSGPGGGPAGFGGMPAGFGQGGFGGRPMGGFGGRGNGGANRWRGGFGGGQGGGRFGGGAPGGAGGGGRFGGGPPGGGGGRVAGWGGGQN